MAIQTAAQKETLAIAYGGAATYGALYTTAPGASAGTEPSGVYARKSLTWTAGAVDGVVTATATFDVPAGATIVGAGVHTAVTAGTYLDGGAVTSQAFATQGTYAATFTFSQS
ncbi:MAG: hypothetical protein ABIQ53_14540 [Terracoccus sp.]